MFGVVPKPLWERRIPADARNRIPMGMRCLLVEHESGLVLIDTGSGNKENAEVPRHLRHRERAAPTDARALEDGIAAAGFSPDDVTLVINTHLHFDHAGGNTFRDADGHGAADVPERALRGAARRVRVRDAHERAHGGELLPAQLGCRCARPGASSWSTATREIVAGHPRAAARRAHAPSPERRARERAARRPASSATWCRPRITCRCPGSWATTWSRW